VERGTTGIVEADGPRAAAFPAPLRDGADQAPPRDQSRLALQNADRLIHTIGDVLSCGAIQTSGALPGREGALRRPAAPSAGAGRLPGRGLP
jgi:hypothetical protein